jgi:DNA replication protein DnaC
VSTADDFCIKGVCDGSGWILDEETDAVKPCECRQIKMNRTSSKRIGTGIPKRFRGVSFERKPIVDMHPMILRQVKSYVRKIDDNIEQGSGMWFQGDVGTGKTSLAMLISKTAIDAGHSVAIYSVPHLLADIKETYEADSTHSYMSLFKRLTTVDLLHLDDLGAERSTEWVLEQLYSIVNERWQDEKSILVTTNLDVVDLREQIGERTVSRLAEICGDPLPLMGPDLRIAAPELPRQAI